jgi:hypothetical protein
VFNKKTFKNKEKKCIDHLPSPALQYMNIHAKTANRLGCFNFITSPSQGMQEDPKMYLHGNASSYEGFLDSIIKKQPYIMNQDQHTMIDQTFEQPQPISYSYMPENQVMKY